MSHLTILPDADRLHLIGLSANTETITLTLCTTGRTASCPVCGIGSGRVHSRYTRTLADLPWQGVPVAVRLQVRRFFCDTPICRQRIFTERLPGVVAPYARRTERLTVWFTHLAFALGGRAGTQVLRGLRVVTSRDTLVRHLRAFPFADRPTPRVLSIDDFALRRGGTYGSILVDLERYCLVDLLPDRSAATFAAWLANHPGVEVISRDRSAEYAEGARRGAPKAVQVVDRFHLLKNLGEGCPARPAALWAVRGTGANTRRLRPDAGLATSRPRGLPRSNTGRNAGAVRGCQGPCCPGDERLG